MLPFLLPSLRPENAAISPPPPEKVAILQLLLLGISGDSSAKPTAKLAICTLQSQKAHCDLCDCNLLGCSGASIVLPEFHSSGSSLGVAVSTDHTYKCTFIRYQWFQHHSMQETIFWNDLGLGSPNLLK